MSDPASFLQQGLLAASDALANLAGRENLHLKPRTLTKSARARCMGRLRALGHLVRRLICLMALSLALPPLPERVRTGAALPDGVEDVTAGFGPQYTFALAPARLGDALGSLPPCTDKACLPGPVDAAPVLARWAALYRLLKHPERAARRFARTLERWRAAGEPKPHILPGGASLRLGTELGLIAGILPQMLAAAFDTWPEPSPG